jgi:alcohol dehydrogenase class IV
MIEAPHGAVCAALLPRAVAVNVRALRSRAPDDRALSRYARVAQLLTGDSSASPEDGAAWLGQLVADLGIPKLSTYGLSREDIPQLVENSARAKAMQPNPVELSREELTEIIEGAL